MSNRNFPELRWKSDIRLLHQFYICYANNTFAIWFKFGYNFRNSIFTNVYRHPSVSSSSLGIEKQWTHFLQQVFLVDILDDILYFAGDLLPWNLIVLNPVYISPETLVLLKNLLFKGKKIHWKPDRAFRSLKIQGSSCKVRGRNSV